MTASGTCACGAIRFEIDTPAVWAWHDHSSLSQKAQGTASVTWVGSWKSRYRLLTGEDAITIFKDAAGCERRFCARCGSPVSLVRPRAPRMVNIPRALFEDRTGREPRYHLGFEEAPDWGYAGERLKPLKGYPGVLWRGSGRVRPKQGADEL